MSNRPSTEPASDASKRAVLWEYTKSASKHGIAKLAGVLGVTAWAIAIGLAFTRLDVSKLLGIVGLCLFAVAVFVGQFLAWRDMRSERDTLKKELHDTQELLEAKRDRLRIREMLSIELYLGEMYLTGIEDVSREFTEEYERLRNEQADNETIKERLSRKLSDPRIDKAAEWDQGVGKYLQTEFDISKGILFQSDHGLTPPPPPPSMESYFVDRWQSQQMRLQRLHDFIAEMQD